MKNFNLSTFLGFCALGLCILIGVVIAGQLIARELPDTTQVPAYIAVEMRDQTDRVEEFDYLSLRQAAYYLGVQETDLQALMDSGELDGIYTKIDRYFIFSKAALQQWIDKRIEEGQP